MEYLVFDVAREREKEQHAFGIYSAGLVRLESLFYKSLAPDSVYTNAELLKILLDHDVVAAAVNWRKSPYNVRGYATLTYNQYFKTWNLGSGYVLPSDRQQSHFSKLEDLIIIEAQKRKAPGIHVLLMAEVGDPFYKHFVKKGYVRTDSEENELFLKLT